MKPNDNYYPLAPTEPIDHRTIEPGISMRDKLAHDFCMAYFSNPDSLQQCAKDDSPSSCYEYFENATIISAFIYADKFIKKSQEHEKI